MGNFKLGSLLLSVVIILVITGNSAKAQNVNIPDTAFLTALLNNPAINTNADGFIQVSEAASYAGIIDVSNLGISDLTGIEAFVMIQILWCSNNQLTTINLSNNSQLTWLRVDGNQLSTLDLNSNPSLVTLDCANNLLSALDISNNALLVYLQAELNQLSSLNVNNNTALSILEVPHNQLTNLDISNNLNLEIFECSYNQISNINVSANADLTGLLIGNNLLTTIDVSSNLNLNSLECGGNQISNLDVSFNTNLKVFNCAGNLLTSLNLQNGNNDSLSAFFAYLNPNLTCIQVDDVSYMNTNWPNAIDATASYNTTCTSCTVNIPDVNFKNLLLSNSAINTNSNSEIECSEASAYNSFINVSNSNIADLTGIEAFTAITMLNCSVNQLTSLDLNANTALINLNCSGNQIQNLSIANTLNLEQLFCGSNLITNLDLSNHIYLEQIVCSNNILSSLNIQNGFNTNLTNFSAVSNLSLVCVTVDDLGYMTSNWPNAIDAAAAYSLACAACTVTIPDNNFKNALLNNALVNTNSNTEIECSEAASYTGFLMLAAYGINDLTGIEAFVNLTGLNCSANSLDTLDVTSNTALVDLRCVGNNLTGLEISYCPNLTKLYCWNNQITSINFADNPNIDTVDCGFNLITSLDFSDNPNLKSIECGDNFLTSLNLSANNQLTYIRCANNQLTSLNLQNGNNANLTFFSATGNPNGLCAQVDDTALMSNNWPNSLPAASSFSTNCGTCTVNIPDANFKNALLSNNLINTNGDNEIQCIEANDFIGIIQVQGLGITDLTGIEAFVNLVELNCAQNMLSGTLDLSSNTFLTDLDCSENQLTGLNVSACTMLYELLCTQNQITGTIDVSTIPNLYYFRCEYNQLTGLDISNNSNLYSLGCGFNQLTTLDVTNNVALVHLECENNQISNLNIDSNTLLQQFSCSNNLIANLNVANNPNLTVLYCDFNQISSLNLSANSLLEFLNFSDNQLSTINFSNNNLLKMVYCPNNQLSGYMDLSNCSGLFNLNCGNNLLSALNIQNGNNLFLTDFNASNNPNLTCIQVDDEVFMTANWSTEIDATSYFSTLCGPCIVNIPDANFKNALLANLNINTDGDNEIGCDEAASYSGFINVSNLNIADLTGIEAFLNIDSLNCGANDLVTLDLSNNTGLIYIQCYGNQLTSINTTGLTDLQVLYCYLNELPSIDVSTNTALILLNCNANQLTTLNTSNNTELISLGCGSNLLNSIDISNNTLLTSFGCNNNFITSLNIQNNPLIGTLGFDNNQISYMDLSGLTVLDDLGATDNNLYYLNIQNGNNINLQDFEATGNPNLTCIQVDDVTFMNNNFASNIDATASFSLFCAGACPSIPLAFVANNTSISSAPMSVTFANNTPNLANYDFVWYFGDGSMLSSNAASVNHTYHFNGIYSVALVAHDNTNDCFDTLQISNYITCNASTALSCNHNVLLNPSGVINACNGSIVPLNSSTSISNAIYQWNRNGVIIGGASQDNFLAIENGNYTLTVFDAIGCPFTSSPTQINYSLQSNAVPTITTTGPANNCGNVNVTLTANGSFANYLWSNGQTGNSITVTQGGSYTVTGQSPACDAVSLPTLINGSNATVPPICMVTVDEVDNKNVIIWEKPTSAAIDSFIILREDINTSGIYTILGAQSYVDLSEFKDVSSDANVRAYRYKLAVKDTCGGITIPSEEQRSMHLDVAQGNSILARQLNWNVYQGQPQAFSHYLIYRETAPGSSNLALIDSVPANQTWYYDNTLTNIADTARAYKIGYRVTTPCVSTRAQNDICSSNVTSNELPVINGLKNNLNNTFNWDIVPNPNNGKFVIQYSSSKLYQLKIQNILGETLFDVQLSSNQSQIDVSEWRNGVYLVTLSNGEYNLTKRLVIAK